ncbi:MAG: hypothetical protein ABSG65_07195 [Bryobacteraceae bacterium]|jgi:hypothetical protein
MRIRQLALAVLLCLTAVALRAADVPNAVKSRFEVSDPVWRELPIRDDLQGQYEKCWQTAVNTILENNFDVATMDKDSGYIRTTDNTGIVTLKGDWVYKVQISVKFSYTPGDPKANPPILPVVQKVRIQAAGEVVHSSGGRLKAYFRGYDKVVLQNLFQDLQAKLGPR